MIQRRRAGAVTPRYGSGGMLARTQMAIDAARNVAAAARRLAPYARKAGAKSSLTRKMFGAGVPVKRVKWNKNIRQTSDSVGQEYSGGNDVTVSKSKVGYKKKLTLSRVQRMLRIGMNYQVYRFQNITNYDTNLGGLNIVNWQSSTGEVISPVHVYDLTSFPNVSNKTAGYYMGWASTAAGANATRQILPGQTSNGTIDGNGYWNLETKGGVNPTTTFPNATKFVHNWTDVRVNFYGPRKRSTFYEILFVRMKDEFASLEGGASSNPELKDFLRYLERPCIYSNLQTYLTQKAKSMRIVKRFKYWVSASQTTDVDTTVGKIKEARIFLRHDKIYGLDYRTLGSELDTIGHAQADGDDYGVDTTHNNTPWFGSRLYMIIRAFAPERTIGTTGFPPGADASKDPTYDIIIRNSISTPA